MVIVGLMLAFVLPRLDNLSPKYALRASVRDVGSIIDIARGSAAAKNRRYAILYEVSNGRYRLFGPPGQDEGMEGQGPGPKGTYPKGAARTLPGGVRFRRIQPLGLRPFDSGELAVFFDPLSLDGSHIVYIEGDGGKLWSIKYNALLGVADYAEGESQFEAPQ